MFLPYDAFARECAISREHPFSFTEVMTLEYIRLGVHIWVSVLILGTMWRLLQYHLVASDNTTWQHLGRAMALQY